jgi:flagellin-like hook-associated protein FlgL
MIVKVYMIQVKSKTLASLQNILSSSVEDSANLIVDLEEIKSKLLDLEMVDEIMDIIKNIIRTKVEYVWFYL